MFQILHKLRVFFVTMRQKVIGKAAGWSAAEHCSRAEDADPGARWKGKMFPAHAALFYLSRRLFKAKRASGRITPQESRNRTGAQAQFRRGLGPNYGGILGRVVALVVDRSNVEHGRVCCGAAARLARGRDVLG